MSNEEYDQKEAALAVAKAQVTQALENIYQARATLGLPAVPSAGTDLAAVPPNLDQTFSSVRQALAELLHSAAQLGIMPSSYNLTPKETIDEFYRRDPQGDIDKIYAQVIKDAPTLKQAQANVEQAQRDLDQAKLELSYCRIVAEIDGVITRRNVNPGNNVQVGQTLMAIRSLRDIWVDANFKGDPTSSPAHRSAGRTRSRYVWRQAHIRRAHFRLYDGDWLDTGVAAGAKCNWQFRQGRPTFAGAD